MYDDEDDLLVLDAEPESPLDRLDPVGEPEPLPDPDEMLPLLAAPDAAQRMLAARAFCVLEEPRAVPPLIALLDDVGMGAEIRDRYPHEFSGGQRQRIGIARALALDPDFIVADEPVSALDVSVQSQVLNLIAGLKKTRGIAFLFISHDLAVIQHVSDEIGVMYLGRLVEHAAVDDLYAAPKHPYTRALMSAIPVPDPKTKRTRIMLEGDVPSPMDPPSGCPFHTRCREVMDICRTVDPPTKDIGPAKAPHHVACHLYS